MTVSTPTPPRPRAASGSSATPLSLPFALQEHLVEAALEKQPEGLDVEAFLEAFRAAAGQFDNLRAVHQTTALAFMAAGACVSADPAIAGPGARPLNEISTRIFTPPKNLRSVGVARQRVVRSLSDRAWTALREPELANSIEGLALLCYLSERFEHPVGPVVKMALVSAGSRRSSDILDHDDSTIPEQSSAYTLGTQLITIAGEESCAHGVEPDIPRYVFYQFVTTTSLTSLPSPPLDLSAAFGTRVLDFVKLFNAVVVPLQNQALDIERLHAKDVVHPRVESTEMLWSKIDEATTYSGSVLERLLVDSRLERGEDGYVENQWTRALVKNLFVQNAAFSAFIFSIHQNIASSSDADLAALLPASEARTLARLLGMSNDIEILQNLTRTLGDVHHALGSYSKALDRLGPSFAPSLLRLPVHDIDSFQRVLDFAGYTDGTASRLAEELEAACKARL